MNEETGRPTPMIDVSASWVVSAGASSARVVDALPDGTVISPRYIALTLGPLGRNSVTVNIEDTAAAEQLLEVLAEAIAEKRRRDGTADPTCPECKCCPPSCLDGCGDERCPCYETAIDQLEKVSDQ